MFPDWRHADCCGENSRAVSIKKDHDENVVNFSTLFQRIFEVDSERITGNMNTRTHVIHCCTLETFNRI